MHKGGRPITLPGPIGDLARVMPSQAELLEELGGIGRKTLWRYAHGRPVPGPARKLLEGLFVKYEIHGRPW